MASRHDPERGGGCLIVTWDGGGNVPPAIALGTRLLRLGHAARVLGPRSIAESVRSAGVPFVAFDSVPAVPPGVNIDDDGDLFTSILSGAGVSDDVSAEIARNRPVAVVADCMMGATLATTERLGLPTAVLVHCLYRPFVEQWGQFVLDCTSTRTRVGLDPLIPPSPGNALSRTALVLALVPETFDFEGEPVPTNTVYVGPVLDPDAVGHAPGEHPGPRTRPTVLISFSTTVQRQELCLPLVMEAMGRLAMDGILTLGGIPEPEHLGAPGNVVVHTFLKHATVLPRVDAVVCHGGLSTVMAALHQGVPLVCIPQGREQGLNAERVEAVGAGRQLPMDSTPEEIADAIADVVGDRRYQLAAAGLSDAIARNGGGERAALLVASLLG